MKDKKLAYSDFCEMIKNAWTFQRLTSEEQEACFHALRMASPILSGRYEARWQQLYAVFRGFLYGVGYTDEAFNSWREPADDKGV